MGISRSQIQSLQRGSQWNELNLDHLKDQKEKLTSELDNQGTNNTPQMTEEEMLEYYNQHAEQIKAWLEAGSKLFNQ